MMSALPVTWLLRNPRGQVASEAVEADIVRVGDGITTIYWRPGARPMRRPAEGLPAWSNA
jgi:hypothetical protein